MPGMTDGMTEFLRLTTTPSPTTTASSLRSDASTTAKSQVVTSRLLPSTMMTSTTAAVTTVRPTTTTTTTALPKTTMTTVRTTAATARPGSIQEVTKQVQPASAERNPSTPSKPVVAPVTAPSLQPLLTNGAQLQQQPQLVQQLMPQQFMGQFNPMRTAAFPNFQQPQMFNPNFQQQPQMFNPNFLQQQQPQRIQQQATPVRLSPSSNQQQQAIAPVGTKQQTGPALNNRISRPAAAASTTNNQQPQRMLINPSDIIPNSIWPQLMPTVQPNTFRAAP